MGIEISPLRVRRSAFITAPPARVWQELASQERLAAWYGIGHTVERLESKVGGEALLSVEVDGQKRRFGGRVLVFEPEHELTYESDWLDEPAWPVPTFHTIRLSALHSGTHIEIFHHGFERMGASAGAELEDYEAGWTNRHLVKLREIVEGG